MLYKIRIWHILPVCLLLACGADQKQVTATPEPEVESQDDQFFNRMGDFAASHILVAWRGAKGAKSDVQVTKEEALIKAEQLLERLKAEPELFETLAIEESDGSSAALGGRLGAWKTGEFVADIEKAVRDLDAGQLVDHVVTSQFGHHVIRRDSLRVKHYAAQGFFISYKSAVQAPAEVTRSKEEAEQLAQSLAGKVNAANFEEMAAKYNDLAKGSQFMGIMRPGDPLPAAAIQTLEKLSYGEVGGPVAFPLGYAFMRREKVELWSGSSILIAYKGARNAAAEVTRSKEEAQSEAAKLIEKLQADPTQFEDLARQHSDSPTAAKGGDMGMWFKGIMMPEFRAAFSKLKVGQMCDTPVATPFGYYIMRRNPLPDHGHRGTSG